MSDHRPIAELLVKDLIARIGSDRVSPGAGAAGAVALSLAAACAAKATAVSLKHRPDDPGLLRMFASFTAAAQLALTEAERDSEAFADFIRQKDAAATSRLLVEGENVGRAITALSAEIEEVTRSVEPNMLGDLAAAKALIDAARSIQERNEAEVSHAP